MLDDFLADYMDSINTDGENNEDGDVENEENRELPILEFQSEEEVMSTIKEIYAGMSSYLEAQKAVETMLLIDKNFEMINSRNNEIEKMWKTGYYTINLGNTCWRSLEKNPDALGWETTQKYIGMCSAVIGFLYKNMVDHWGTVPFLHLDSTLEDRLPRPSEEEMMICISERLEIAYYTLEQGGFISVDLLSPQAMLIANAETKANTPEAALSFLEKFWHINGAEDIIFTSICPDSQEQIIIYTTEYAEMLRSELLYKMGRIAEAKYDYNELINIWGNSNYGYWALLKRLGRFTEIVGCPEYMQYLPIPYSEMERNENMLQNPGYIN